MWVPVAIAGSVLLLTAQESSEIPQTVMDATAQPGVCAGMSMDMVAGDSDRVEAILARSGVTISRPIGTPISGYACSGGGPIDDQQIFSLSLFVSLDNGLEAEIHYVNPTKASRVMSDLMMTIDDGQAIGADSPGVPIQVRADVIVVSTDDLSDIDFSTILQTNALDHRTSAEALIGLQEVLIQYQESPGTRPSHVLITDNGQVVGVPR